VIWRDGQPLPSWIRNDAKKNVMILSAVPADGLPFSLQLTTGDLTTVVAVTEY